MGRLSFMLHPNINHALTNHSKVKTKAVFIQRHVQYLWSMGLSTCNCVGVNLIFYNIYINGKYINGKYVLFIVLENGNSRYQSSSTQDASLV